MADRAYVRAVMHAGLVLLPEEMRSPEAVALLQAIGWQESRWIYRRQLRGGPARGFFQFEREGVRAVQNNVRSRPHLMGALKRAGCAALFDDEEALHAALEFHDPVAVALARLLLWTHPEPLPGRADRDQGWAQYVALWRPGRPRHDVWPSAWAYGWEEESR
jgi:hypothetical protein